MKTITDKVINDLFDRNEKSTVINIKYVYEYCTMSLLIIQLLIISISTIQKNEAKESLAKLRITLRSSEVLAYIIFTCTFGLFNLYGAYLYHVLASFSFCMVSKNN